MNVPWVHRFRYVPLEMPSVGFRSRAASDYIQLFTRLVDDETYRRIAEEAGMVAVPSQMTHALIRLRRSVADLVSRPAFADTTEATVRSIQAATNVPLPEATLITRLLERPSVLPLLVRLDGAEARAMQVLEKAKSVDA